LRLVVSLIEGCLNTVLWLSPSALEDLRDCTRR
jgi:hypothetical protein